MPTSGVTYPKVGSAIQLVRWNMADDRWYPEIVRGRFQGRDAEAWILTVEGETRSLPADEWAVYKD